MALVGSEKSYTKTFFVISQVFMLLMLYSLYDEFVVRRPWHAIQTRYNELEMLKAKTTYDQEYKKFYAKSDKGDSPDAQVKALEKKIDELTQNKNDAVAKKDDSGLPKNCSGKSLSACLHRLTTDYNEIALVIKNEKSVLDSLYYQWKHAVLEGHDSEAKEKETEYKELDHLIAENIKKRDAVEKELNAVKAKITDLEKDITAAKKKIEELKTPLEDAKKVVDNIGFRPVEIKQVVIDDFGKGGNIYWGKVDRCQTCHVGTTKLGNEDVVKAFGLTVVTAQKDKNGEVENEEAIKSRIAEIVRKDPSKKGLVITEGQKREYQVLYGTHPRLQSLIGKHPVENFGCTTCHGGDGRGLNVRGEYFGHVDKVHATHHHGVEPLLRGDQMESNCLSCHNGQIQFKSAPHLTHGAEVFVEMGCQGCHAAKGYDGLHKVGPEIAKVGNKVKKEWLVDWLKNPHNYMPNARMPNFGLSDDDVVAVSSFLISQSEKHEIKQQTNISAGSVENGKKLFSSVGCQGCHSAVQSDTTKRQRAPNLSRIMAKVEDPQWIYDWIKDPKNYSHNSRMPNLRLTDEEARDITAYLSSQGKDYSSEITKRSGALAQKVDAASQALVDQGKKVVTNRGCYACHAIKGFEKAERIGPELTKLALKEPFELDYGDALSHAFKFKDVEGKTVLVTHNAEKVAIHNKDANNQAEKTSGVDRVVNLVETWESWVRNKVQNPMHIYKHVRADLKMPTFKLFDDEIDSLMVFLKGLNGRPVSAKYDASALPDTMAMIKAQRLMSEKNCLGCHNVLDDGKQISKTGKNYSTQYGGDIIPKIDSYIENYFESDIGSGQNYFYPPTLDHVGSRIRPEWLVSFLKDPKPFRPVMFVRMPSFDLSEDQINILVDGFAGMSHVSTEYTSTDYKVKSVDIKKGEEHMTQQDCFKCHLMPNGTLKGNAKYVTAAPNFALMKDKLRYDFFPEWVKAPSSYQRFSPMTPFFNDGQDHSEELRTLRDYILSLGGAEVTE